MTTIEECNQMKGSVEQVVYDGCIESAKSSSSSASATHVDDKSKKEAESAGYTYGGKRYKRKSLKRKHRKSSRRLRRKSSRRSRR
jgi:hypothetical protein